MDTSDDGAAEAATMTTLAIMSMMKDALDGCGAPTTVVELCWRQSEAAITAVMIPIQSDPMDLVGDIDGEGGKSIEMATFKREGEITPTIKLEAGEV